jgi:subtilisin family serine protease
MPARDRRIERARLAVILLAVLLAGAAAHVHATTKVSPALGRAMAAAAPDADLAVWVVFGEKRGVTAEALRTIESGLTPHARARRARNRDVASLVDAYDAPVSRAHIDALRSAGARVRHASRWLNAVSIDATAAEIRAVAAWPEVARVDVVHVARSPRPEPEVTPPARGPLRAPEALSYDYGGSLFQNLLINIPAMHDLGLHGEGVMIALLDTGFNNLTHPALAGLDVLVTHDFVNGDSVVADEIGQMGSGYHGALVLGAMAGFAPGELIGPAFGATYLLAKTENTQWERHIEEDAWVAAAEWADSIGADVISSSLTYLDGFTNGETGYTWPEMDGATAFITIGADIAASRGILIVNAAGNDGFVSEPANTLGAPADGDMVLTVGATDSGGSRSAFSSVGNTSDGRTKPDVMAMGQSVYTISSFDPSYVTTSGTSLSTPLVAGAAALVLQARPLASNNMLMNALRQTADNAGAPNRLVGWGVIDALAARNAIASSVRGTPDVPLAALVAYPNPFNPATTVEYDVPSGGRVTIAAYDAAGRRVATLVDAEKTAGHYRVRWNARGEGGEPLASGVYLLSLSGPGFHSSRKVVLLK